MRKNQLIELANNVVLSDKKLSFITTFGNSCDREIVALLCAWCSNGYQGEYVAITNLIERYLGAKPCLGVFDWKPLEEDINDECFFATLTNRNFNALIEKLRYIYTNNDTLFSAYNTQISCYPHETFAKLLSGGTGFPTITNTCTFYRYSLLFYWLTYKRADGRWENIDTSNALLPCNDKIFDNAFKLGITKKRLNSTLTSTIALTRIARSWFGDEDFYKMYELLNYYDA